MEKLKIQKNKCWEWTGTLNKKGYGVVRIQGVNFTAHRLSWLLFNGGGWRGLQVLHRCDNRKCINPNHLFLGTNADNLADRQAKGRQSRGEKHPTAKLKEFEVKEIRRLVSVGMEIAKIAQNYNVHWSTIYNMIKGKTWKHI